MLSPTHPVDDRHKAKAHACDQFLRRKPTTRMASTDPRRNVLGVGIGAKANRKGERFEREAIRFYVEKKVEPETDIPTEHVLPKELGGFKTDVVEVGRFRRGAMPVHDPGTHDPGNHLLDAHTIRPGTSCGVRFGRCGDGATGTVGAIVSKDDKPHILSTAHVLARTNGFLLGAPILCPGPIDLPLLAGDVSHGQAGGHGQSKHAGHRALSSLETFQRARLAEIVPLWLERPNLMDAALAEIVEPPFDPSIVEIGRLTSRSAIQPFRGMQVMKYGVATGLSRGVVVDTDFDGYVDFPTGALRFDNQVLIEGDDESAFAWEGDSGALIVTRFAWDRGGPCQGEQVTLAVALIVGFSMPEATTEPPRSFCLATDLSLILSRLGADLLIG